MNAISNSKIESLIICSVHLTEKKLSDGMLLWNFTKYRSVTE